MSDVEMKTAGEAPAETSVSEEAGKQVPVSEAIRFRRRAQSAEAEQARLAGEVESMREQLEAARQEVESLKVRSEIDSALRQAGALDVESALLLAQERLADGAATVAEAVERVKREKPHLFASARRRSSALGAEVIEETAGAGLERAASAARQSGRREDLLRYLRIRRRAVRPG